MFLIIFEDDNVKAKEKLSYDDFDACDYGVCALLDISNPKAPKEYNPNTNTWENLEVLI
jgi:hypothetical protein